MKQKLSFIILLLSINILSAQNFDYQRDFKKLVKQSKDSESPNNYEKLKGAFLKKGEDFTSEQVVALMAGQTASGFYDAYGMVEEERLYQVATTFPSDTIHKYGTPFLELYPVNFSLNYGLWKTYEKDNDKENAAKFKKRFESIAAAILSTGDGTRKKPYFVISPIDGQVLIKLYYKKEIGMMGSGRDSNGNFLDILEMVDGKKTKSLNFVIAHAMGPFKLQIEEVQEEEPEED